MRLRIVNIVIVGLCYLTASAQINKKQLTYDDFKSHLKIDFNYELLIETFGQPSKEIGSGIFIYVYDLYDSTEVMIGYSDRIIYADHTDKNSNVLNRLLSYSEPKISNACIDYYFNNYQFINIEKPIDEIFKYNKGLTFRNYKVVDTYSAYFDKNTYIEIKVDKFDINQHTVTRDLTDGCIDPSHSIKIDGEIFWGSDGDLPLFEFKSAFFIMSNKKFKIPVHNMYNPWFVKPISFSRYLCNENYIYLLSFSDGAGGYIAFYLETFHGLELIDVIMP